MTRPLIFTASTDDEWDADRGTRYYFVLYLNGHEVHREECANHGSDDSDAEAWATRIIQILIGNAYAHR